MTAQTLQNPNVATVDSSVDVRQAAVLMRQEHVGDLVITELRDGHIQPVGVITDRDIVVEVVAKGVDPATVTVGDTIKRELVTVREDSGIAAALGKMRSSGVRRAPVVNANGELTGVLSIDDIIEHIAEQLSDVAGAIRHEQSLEATKIT